jgi:transcriptional regulator with XRE-family HTH domain
MDTNWFQEALNRAGLTQADLARDLELAPSAVSRMLRGERQMKLAEAIQTAAFLGVSEEEVLRRAGATDTSEREPRRRGRPPRSATMASAPALRQDTVPIRSAGEQHRAPDDGPIGYTLRPANLAGVRDAYAIYMVGDAMEPRYEPGWLLHIHPFKPPTRGRDVVVYTKDQRVLIEQFVQWDGEVLVLRRIHPDETFRIPRDDVLSCHLIVGVDQEG